MSGSEIFSQDPGFINNILIENRIISRLLDMLLHIGHMTNTGGSTQPHVDIYDFTKFLLTKNANSDSYVNPLYLVETISNHPKINRLYLSIILDNNVEYYLSMIDPRANNHKAYFMAKETGNPYIIKLVKDAIISWNLTENAALRKIFNLSPDVNQTFNMGKDIYERNF